MKILFVHNDYIRPSGEEAASSELAKMLEDHGHEVAWFRKSSSGISGIGSKLKAFVLGIYNSKSPKQLKEIIDSFHPDIVQVQNLYPFISTSIFKELRQSNVPVVMRCPNYRLFCPNGLCLDSKGRVCEKCFGTGKELWCAVKNCENSRLKSIGYALRGAYARFSRSILDGVDVFIVQSDFQKNKFVAQGISADRIAILPGIAPDICMPNTEEPGRWVSFVGRVSREKGIDEFIEAAKLNPRIPFKVAGNVDASYHIPSDLPQNVEFVGFLSGDALNDFYLKSKMIVVPSKWYEGFPNVIVRAMLLKRPVVSTSIGCMQSIIRSGENGILVPPANGQLLANAISSLYDDEDACLKMAANGYYDATTEYSREHIYQTLINIYDMATFRKQTTITPRIP